MMKCLLIRMTQQPRPMPTILIHFNERGRITQEALRETGFLLNRTVGIDIARTSRKRYGDAAVHTRLESELKSRKARVRSITVMSASGDVRVVNITVLQQSAQV